MLDADATFHVMATQVAIHATGNALDARWEDYPLTRSHHVVILGLEPRIQLSGGTVRPSNCGGLDPRDEPEDDRVRKSCRGEASRFEVVRS